MSHIIISVIVFRTEALEKNRQDLYYYITTINGRNDQRDSLAHERSQTQIEKKKRGGECGEK